MKIYHQDHLDLPTPASQNNVLRELLNNSIQTHIPTTTDKGFSCIASASSKGSTVPTIHFFLLFNCELGITANTYKLFYTF